MLRSALLVGRLQSPICYSGTVICVCDSDVLPAQPIGVNSECKQRKKTFCSRRRGETEGSTSLSFDDDDDEDDIDDDDGDDNDNEDNGNDQSTPVVAAVVRIDECRGYRRTAKADIVRKGEQQKKKQTDVFVNNCCCC